MAVLAVPVPDGAGDGGEHHVDHAAAEGALGLAQRLEGDLDAREPPRAAEVAQRRLAPLAEVGEQRPRDPPGAQQGARVARRLPERARHAHGRARRPGRRDLARRAPARRLARLGPAARRLVDRRRERLALALGVGQRGQDRVAADAVGDGVVQPEEDRGPALRTLDLDQLPERARAVEGPLVDRADGAEDVLEVAGLAAPPRERVAAHVEVEVEGRVLLPARQGQVEGRVDHPLPQPRHGLDHPRRRGGKPLRVRRPVEQHQHRHRRALAGLVRVPEREVLGGERRGMRRRGGHAGSGPRA